MDKTIEAHQGLFISAVLGVAAYYGSRFFAPKDWAFFYTIVVSFPVLLALSIKDNMTIRNKCRCIGKWEIIAPVLLFLFAAYHEPTNVLTNVYRLICFEVASVAAGVSLRLLFHAPRAIL